jgi:ech hydrogenase subunit D
MSQQVIKNISPNDLLSEVLKLKNESYRLVAITCTNNGTPELSYSFGKDYDLISYRFLADTGTEISSISVIYPYSFLYENEIKELFGVNIKDINIDFNNTLYKISVKTPFSMEEKGK